MPKTGKPYARFVFALRAKPQSMAPIYHFALIRGMIAAKRLSYRFTVVLLPSFGKTAKHDKQAVPHDVAAHVKQNERIFADTEIWPFIVRVFRAGKCFSVATCRTVLELSAEKGCGINAFAH